MCVKNRGSKYKLFCLNRNMSSKNKIVNSRRHETFFGSAWSGWMLKHAMNSRKINPRLNDKYHILAEVLTCIPGL
jgi:hypothetical protein